jgi:hypothetical protein
MHTLIATLLPLVDEVPKPEDVKAGWLALVVFLALGVAIAVIGFFLVRSLRRSRATAEHGGYDRSDRTRSAEPVDPDTLNP